MQKYKNIQFNERRDENFYVVTKWTYAASLPYPLDPKNTIE